MLPITLYQQRKASQLENLSPRLKAWGNAIAHRIMAQGHKNELDDKAAQFEINRQVWSCFFFIQ